MSAEDLLFDALILERQGYYGPAISILEQIAADASQVNENILMARLLHRVGQSSEALSKLRYTLNATGDNAVKHPMSLLLASCGAYDQALSLLESIPLSDREQAFHKTRAHIFLQMSFVGKAEADLHVASSYGPMSLDVLKLGLLISCKRHDKEKTLSILHQILEHAELTYVDLVEICPPLSGARLGRQARVVLERAKSLNREGVDLAYLQGQLDYVEGRFSEAVLWFEKCLSTRPQWEAAADSLAWACYRTGDRARAKEIIEQVNPSWRSMALRKLQIKIALAEFRIIKAAVLTFAFIFKSPQPY